MTRFQRLFSSLAGPALARQLSLAELLGDRPWSVDLERGQIQFGDDLVYPIQLLGTESEPNQTWLWGWSNQSPVPPPLLEAAEQLRVYGRQHDLPELVNSTFSLEIATGHQLAMVATGLTRKTCYYRSPYENGAAYFLLAGLPPELFAPLSAARIGAIIGQAIETFTLDHEALASTLLQEQGFALSTAADGWHAIRDDGSAIDLTFDPQARITEFHATLPGERAGG